MKILTANVYVVGPSGSGPVLLAAGSEPPAWAADQIGADRLVDAEPEPEPEPEGEPDGDPAGDGGHEPEGDGDDENAGEGEPAGELEESEQNADADPSDDTASDDTGIDGDGAANEDDSDDLPVPIPGTPGTRGGGAKLWRAYARARGFEIESGASAAQIRDALAAAGVPVQ